MRRIVDDQKKKNPEKGLFAAEDYREWRADTYCRYAVTVPSHVVFPLPPPLNNPTIPASYYKSTTIGEQRIPPILPPLHCKK